jgi:hypothetical protein
MAHRHFLIRNKDTLKALCGGNWNYETDLSPFPAFIDCPKCKELLGLTSDYKK